jgi:tripartite-type tricarboxylate transporter receptor subunit TctC
MMKRVLFVVAAVSICALATGAQAEYPEKPIKLVVPFAAGGGSDSMARIFQRVIKDKDLLNGQPIVIVNVDGAGGMIGARQVKDAEPDGYTYLQIRVSLVNNQAMGSTDLGIEDFVSGAVTARGMTGAGHVIVGCHAHGSRRP